MGKNSLKIFFAVYYCALLLGVTLQTILKFVFMDASTGFYRSGTLGIPSSYILAGVFVLAILFWFLMTLFRRTRNDYPIGYSHRLTSVFSVLTGAAILGYTLLDVTPQVQNPASTPIWNKVMVGLVFFAGIAAAVSMIVGGIGSRFLRDGKPGAVLGIFPCLWQLMLLLSRFNHLIAVTTLSDVLLNLLFMSFAAIFLLGQSRIIYGLGVRTSRTYAIPAGLSLSLAGFTLTISNLLYAASHGGFMSAVTIPLSETLYMLILSLYAIVFLTGYAKSIRKV